MSDEHSASLVPAGGGRAASKRRTFWNGAFVFFIFFVLLPAMFEVLLLDVKASVAIGIALNTAALAMLFRGVFARLQELFFPGIVRMAGAVAGATYAVLLNVVLLYVWVEQHPLDLSFIREGFGQLVRTAIALFGASTVFWCAVGLLLMGCLYAALLVQVFKQDLERYVSATKMVVASFVLVVTPWPPGLFIVHTAADPASTDKPIGAHATMSRYAFDGSDAEEDVIILHLESVNALAAGGYLAMDGIAYDGDYMPMLRKLALRGVFFPLFWGNSIITNRAQETVLCGIVKNVGRTFFVRPQELDGWCLPALLRSAGYATAFYKSYDLSYADTGPFMKRIGFDEVIDGSSLMRPGDPEYIWGYDDCTFYRRVFDHLRATYDPDQKLFAYIEVSSHHALFGDPGLAKAYASVRPFQQPRNFVEKYLNSYAIQDHCLQAFYEAFQRYDDGRTHVIIMGDHSFPVGVHGSYRNSEGASTDNFLTQLLYLPPTSKASFYRVGSEQSDPWYSQSDMIPTILELLSGDHYQNSLSPLLTASADNDPGDYERCHVVTQPFDGGKVTIVQGPDKYTYFLKERTLYHSNVERDLLERNVTVIAQDMSYEQFLDMYLCARYRDDTAVRLPL